VSISDLHVKWAAQDDNIGAREVNALLIYLSLVLEFFGKAPLKAGRFPDETPSFSQKNDLRNPINRLAARRACWTLHLVRLLMDVYSWTLKSFNGNGRNPYKTFSHRL